MLIAITEDPGAAPPTNVRLPPGPPGVALLELEVSGGGTSVRMYRPVLSPPMVCERRTISEIPAAVSSV